MAFIWAVLIVARLIQLQVFQHPKFAEMAREQQQRVEEIKAPRGAILDRYGQRLAMSLPAESVVVDPLRVPDLTIAADVLSKVLNLDARDLLVSLKTAVDDRRGFLWVKRKITRQEAKRLRDLNLEWIEFRTESQRYYPNRSLAAHVIGSVDFEEEGNGGVEQSLNDQLAGHAGELLVTEDVQRRGFASKMENEAQPGQDVQLTIDSRIQFVAEQELAKMVAIHHAKSGSLVAMDPRTGDILAMANVPTFDPNEPPKRGAIAARENLAVSAPFEPGSVYKVITLSSALETTRLRPESMINCGNGSINLFGRIIHDHSRYASLSMADVLARSSNIGAINIGLQVGDKNLFEYIRRFGFGKKTGLPLPGESSGMVRPLRVWQKSSIGSVAMGHEIGVTALQLAQACTVIASGGLLMKPRLRMDAPKVDPVRVLKPETAITMRGMMEGVVIKPYGTGHKYARLIGYTSAGKTGTAQIYDNRTHQYTHLYNASFMGFAPVTNPRIVIVVTINGTEGTVGYGGPTSAPVFREVAAAGLRVMDVPKDLPEMVPSDGSHPADENDVAIADLGSSIPPPLVQAGNAVAADDRPVASANSASDQRLFSRPEGSSGQDLAGPRVPNFQGKTVRNVIEQAAALGIPMEFSGSGIARAQVPEPGAILPLGQRVRVQFGR
ncbi:MAG TPA: penicillin-binding protein [Bryobacteraceae bacterium]|jgi:cell division protein FtsI (penicillin-binding protein 3)|nr:penicillin-binding protein [Bryobacteraceae bacterium]